MNQCSFPILIPRTISCLLAYCILITLWSSSVDAQQSQYIYEQFTTVDGMPSNECHEIFEDSQGFIWIGTDNGLVKYDGYQFKTYNEKHGLDNKVIFEIKEDSLQRIWVSGLSKNLYILDRKEDKFIPYRYNSKIHSIEKENFTIPYIEYFEFSGDTLIIQQNGLCILKINSKGVITHLNEQKKDHHIIHKIGKQLMINGCTHCTGNILHFKDRDLDTLLNGSKMIPRSLKVLSTYSTISFAFNQSFFFKTPKNTMVKHEGIAANIKEISKGYVACLVNGEGVKLYNRNTFQYEANIISDISATGFIEDRQGGYWITSLEKGVFYIPNPSITYHNVENKHVFNKQIESANDTIYTSDQNGYIYVFDSLNDISSKLPNSNGQSILKKNPKDNTIWFSFLGTLFSLDYSFKSFDMEHSPIMDIHFSPDRVWSLRYNGTLYSYNYQGINQEILNLNYYSSSIMRSLSMSMDGDSLFLGTTDGLYYKNIYTQDTFQLIPYFEDTQIKQIIKGNQGELIIVAKGIGIGIISSLDSISLIHESNGLISNQIENVYLAPNNTLWVSTLDGISKISNYNNPDREIKNITTSHGLPSPDIYDITSLNETIYAASSQGIVKFNHSLYENEDTPMPKITNIDVNNREINIDSISRFPYYDNTFTIEFLTLNYAHRKNIKHRYRLNEGIWNYTDENHFMLFDLEPNSYILDLQSNNKNGNWSNSTTMRFTIKKPWWKTIIFILLISVIGLILLGLIIKRKLESIKTDNELKKSIRILEKKALSAQMSPHFIFNCLNSIQRYIMENDQDVAIEYLEKFSDLIRMYLDQSKNDEVTLSDEINMLSHYLQLEQLRFNDNFDYKIILSNEFNSYDIKIPSMLIQPFVENAVLHGMKYKKNKDGIIRIQIKKFRDFIEVKIQDNGPGIQQNTLQSSHDSKGLSITQRRLALLHEKAKSDSYFEISSSERGTMIELKIPFEN